MASRRTALVLATLAAGVHAQPGAVTVAKAIKLPTCSVENMGYNVTEVRPMSQVIPLCQHDCAQGCQDECKKTVECFHFMYYKNSGGCWLFQHGVELVNVPGVISGPLECDSVVPEAEPVVVVEPKAVPAPVPVSDALPANSTLVSGAEGGPMALLPWWGWLLIILAIVLCAVFLIVFACCRSRGPNKKRSAKTSKGSVSSVAQAPLHEAAREEALEASMPLLMPSVQQLELTSPAPPLEFPSSPLPVLHMPPIIAAPVVRPDYEVASPVITAVVRAPPEPAQQSFLQQSFPQQSFPQQSFPQQSFPQQSFATFASFGAGSLSLPEVPQAPSHYATAPPMYFQAPTTQFAPESLVAPPQYQYTSETVVAPTQYVQGPPVQQPTETVVAPTQYMQAAPVQTFVAPAQYIQGPPVQYSTETVVVPAQYVQAPQHETVVAPPQYVNYVEAAPVQYFTAPAEYVDYATAPAQYATAQYAQAVEEQPQPQQSQPLYMEPIAGAPGPYN